MAGLGEGCGHIASLVWAIEGGVKKRDYLTVTDKKAYWVMHSAVISVPYERIKEIKFFKSCGEPKPSRHHPPLQCEVKNLFNALQKCPSKPSVLSLIDPHSDAYVPTSLKPHLPPSLSELRDKNMIIAGFHEILQALEKLPDKFNITKDQKAAVEKETREQSSSRLWFRMRCGRITAFRFKSVCRTDPVCPSLSLIMGICHPDLSKFATNATKWGCDHESTAREAYLHQAQNENDNLSQREAGLFISTEYAY